MIEEMAEDEVTGRGVILNHGLPILESDQYRCTRCGREDLNITDTRLSTF